MGEAIILMLLGYLVYKVHSLAAKIAQRTEKELSDVKEEDSRLESDHNRKE
jgi:hypothetical protein